MTKIKEFIFCYFCRHFNYLSTLVKKINARESGETREHRGHCFTGRPVYWGWPGGGGSHQS